MSCLLCLATDQYSRAQSTDLARYFKNLVCIILFYCSRLTDMANSLIPGESAYINLIFRKMMITRLKAFAKRHGTKNTKRQSNHDFEPCSQGNQSTYTHTFDVYVIGEDVL